MANLCAVESHVRDHIAAVHWNPFVLPGLTVDPNMDVRRWCFVQQMKPRDVEECPMAADFIHLTMAFAFLVLWAIIGQFAVVNRQA